MSPALARAFAHAAELQRTKRVRLRRPDVVHKGLARRAADAVPFSPQPISILAPHPENPVELREFVLEQFPPKARRLAR